MSLYRLKDGAHSPEPDTAPTVRIEEYRNRPKDAQNPGHIELSGPNPATRCSKTRVEAIGTRFRDDASTRLRTIGPARHPRLYDARRLRTSRQRVQRVLICALRQRQCIAMWLYARAREAHHEVDSFDDVNLAIVRPRRPFGPKCWPHLRSSDS